MTARAASLDLDDDLPHAPAVVSFNPWADAYAAAKLAPVKLDEMIAALDDVAGSESASQRAMVTAGLRLTCFAPTVRRIVALEAAMEILAALASDRAFAVKISQAVAAKRKELA